MSIENLKRLASAIGSVEFHTEGFEQIVGNGTFYGGLIMHQDGENIIAQCVLEPWASYLAAANPKAVLELIAALEARDRALQTIARWDLPAVDGKWPDGSQMSYGAAYGSNGEREYMRQVALNALKDRAPAAPVVAEGLRDADKAMWDLQEFYKHDARALEAIAECRAALAAHPVAGSPAEAEPEVASMLQEARDSLAAAHDFQSTSRGAQDCINNALDLLDKIEASSRTPAAAEPMPASEAARIGMAVLEWNRAMHPAPIVVGKEMFVANAVAQMIASLATPAAPTDAKADAIPLGYVDKKPVFVGAELEQRVKDGWVRHNAQESWRGLDIDWDNDMRWPATAAPSVRDAAPPQTKGDHHFEERG